MNDLQISIDMLNTELGELRQRKVNDAQIMLDVGDDWSDPQWDGYHCNQEHLQERIDYLEEQLANLG